MTAFTTIALHYLCAGQIEYAPPWLDGQKWAETTFSNPPFDLADVSAHSLILQPTYGSGAALYRVDITGADGTSVHWRHARVQLIVNQLSFGPPAPVAWYVGCPTDMPTGIARFQEHIGPRPYAEQHDLPAGVWALTFRRSA